MSAPPAAGPAPATTGVAETPETVLSDLGERRLLAEHLPAVRCVPAQATYLAWLDCRALDLGGDPADVFLERGRVALNSGIPFGTGGEGFVRLNLATSPELITEAVRRMAVALD